jgi:CheY-like chemotaxis protein
MDKSRRCKILIVDDQEPMRLLLAQFIGQDLRAEVTLAGTCEAALRLARENTYDVILLDLMMPGIGGVEVLRRIRADSANKSTAVIVVSILAGAPEGGEHMSIVHARALGANAVVPKPVHRGYLLSTVKAHLGAEVGAAS